MLRLLTLLTLSTVFLAGCGNGDTAKTDVVESDMPNPVVADANEANMIEKSCKSSAGFDVYCGFYNPEDLVIVPGGEQLLVSEMGEFRVHEPSGFALLDLATNSRLDIAVDWTKALEPSGERWGAQGCEAPASELFSPHGIDLIQRADDKYQVLAVNHGGRESVEFFELNEGNEAWQLIWRGCALPPGDPFINDVAALQDGGFFVTHMWNKSEPFEQVVTKLLSGVKTGWVYEWQADTGFRQLPSSIENMPNGIAVNADNSKIFVNIYIGNKTIRIDRASGEVDGEFEVQQPDNITVDESGQIWVASHKHDPINQTCTEPGVCLLPFEIVTADPISMEAKVAIAHDGAPMGYSTVALRVKDRIFMGSAHGDRIASIKVE